MTRIQKLLAITGVAMSMAAVAASDLESSIVENIKPVHSVCMAGDDCAAAPAAPVASGPRSGEEVYSSKCGTCHAVGVAGAPKFGNAADWAPRIAKGSDTLYVSAINGFNGMPAKGLCMDCSDDEIKAAVNYMLDGSK